MHSNNFIRINSLLALVFLLALVSCKKNDTVTAENRAVVEAYLQPGQKASVKISKQIPVNADSSTSYALTNLQVSITYNGNTYTLLHTGNGIYTNTTMPIVIGGSYNLQFSYNGVAVSATTTLPSKPTDYQASATSITLPTFGSGGGMPTIPDPVKLTWSNSASNYHFVVVKPVDANPTAITNTIGGGAANQNSPDQGSSKEINISDFKYYGRNVMLLYRVLPEYAALYNSNGSSSQNITNVPTNVQNGLGIFTGVTPADSLFINVN